MRMMRFIGVVVILCVGMAGQSDAQMPAKGETPSVAEMAVGRRYQAIVNNLLDTVEKCNAQRQGKGDTTPWCDVYEEQIKQTPIDVLCLLKSGRN